MKYTTIEDLKWLISVALVLMILVPVILYDHLKQVKRVKRNAHVRKLSKKYVTVTGDIVRHSRGRARA